MLRNTNLQMYQSVGWFTSDIHKKLQNMVSNRTQQSLPPPNHTLPYILYFDTVMGEVNQIEG